MFARRAVFIALALPCFLVFCADLKMIREDAALKKIMDSLPDNWSLRSEDNRIIFERSGETWVLFENQVNAPMSLESDAERSARIKKFGVKTVTRLVYRFEEKWPLQKREQTEKANSAIASEISGLMQKYNITHLYDEMLSAKGDEFFRQGTPEEEKRIAEYKERKAELEKRIAALPAFTTEKYSFFFIEGSGYSDSFHFAYPFTATTEAYAVLDLLKNTGDH
jgi:hypothetical protein